MFSLTPEKDIPICHLEVKCFSITLELTKYNIYYFVSGSFRLPNIFFFTLADRFICPRTLLCMCHRGRSLVKGLLKMFLTFVIWLKDNKNEWSPVKVKYNWSDKNTDLKQIIMISEI